LEQCVADVFSWVQWPIWHTEHFEIMKRLCAALLAGAIIGFERSFHGRPAGIRTHSLVCLASAMLMLVTVYQAQWFPDGQDAVRVDPTRMAQGVMTGIGFLGAGVIIRDGVAVRGLTTAASIWITSAIGILAGIGFYFPLVAVTLLSLCALSLFRRLESAMPSFSYAAHSVVVAVESTIDEAALKSFLRSLGFDVHQVSCQRDLVARTAKYDMTIRTKAKDGLSQLYAAWSKRHDVVSYSILPL
jgi:putative Mg2+ transporter-C (MgtC) family protein